MSTESSPSWTSSAQSYPIINAKFNGLFSCAFQTDQNAATVSSMLILTVNNTGYIVLGRTTSNGNIAANSPYGYLYGGCMVDYVVSGAFSNKRTLAGLVGAGMLAVALHP